MAFCHILLKANMNYEVTNSPCRVTITVHAKWNWWSVIGGPLAFGLFWRYQAAHGNAQNLSAPFLILVIGAISLQLLWSLGGRETLCFGDDQLEATRRVLFFARSRHFPLKQISEPFFVAAIKGGEDGDTPSGIGFDYQGTHYRFLDHLDEPDVAHIVGLLRGSYPELVKLWDNPHPHFDGGGITTLGLSSR
jgi:hypothetical protein